MIEENMVRIILSIFSLVQIIVYRLFASLASKKLEDYFDREKEEFGYTDEHFSKQREGIFKLIALLNSLLIIAATVFVYDLVRFFVSSKYLYDSQ